MSNGAKQIVSTVKAEDLAALIAAAILAAGAPTGAATAAKQDTGNTSLGIMDDWDESDRAKVNPIVGQAGVSANAGAVDAATIRVVMANSMGKTLKFAAIAVAGSQTDTDIVAAVANKSIKVVGICIIATAATTVLLESGASTALTGTMSFATNGGWRDGCTAPQCIMKTASGEALKITTGAGAVAGYISYFDDDAS